MPVDSGRILDRTFVAEVELHATLGSTNDLAKLRAAESSRQLPLLVIAELQTAGRGRGANRWWSGPGSLAFSLVLDIGEIGRLRHRSPMLALAAAVAVAEVVAIRAPAWEVGLHWPNDVFAGGRKIAGILVEVLSDKRCVVGVGVNTNNSLRDAPPEIRPSATTLLELTGTHHDHTEVLISILGGLERLFRELACCPQQIGQRANALCLQRGKVLTIDLGHHATRGTCAGIAADGALLLDTPKGRQKFYSGILRHESR